MMKINENIIDRIKKLGKYQPGWHNGKDGLPASLQTIDDAIKFTLSMEWGKLYIPYISLAADGEVSFWWSNKEFKLAINFYGDKTYSYYGKIVSTNEEFYGDDLDLHTKLPKELFDCLTKKVV